MESTNQKNLPTTKENKKSFAGKVPLSKNKEGARKK